jgi:hypothetical protein
VLRAGGRRPGAGGPTSRPALAAALAWPADQERRRRRVDEKVKSSCGSSSGGGTGDFGRSTRSRRSASRCARCRRRGHRRRGPPRRGGRVARNESSAATAGRSPTSAWRTITSTPSVRRASTARSRGVRLRRPTSTDAVRRVRRGCGRRPGRDPQTAGDEERPSVDSGAFVIVGETARAAVQARHEGGRPGRPRSSSPDRPMACTIAAASAGVNGSEIDRTGAAAAPRPPESAKPERRLDHVGGRVGRRRRPGAGRDGQTRPPSSRRAPGKGLSGGEERVAGPGGSDGGRRTP